MLLKLHEREDVDEISPVNQSGRTEKEGDDEITPYIVHPPGTERGESVTKGRKLVPRLSSLTTKERDMEEMEDESTELSGTLPV